jgi:predicted porin
VKPRQFLPLLLGVCAGCTLAQTHVTLYGSIGLAVRHKTNAKPQGPPSWSMGASPNAAGIWGVYGTEDLGGGMKAHFNVESGFSPETGSLSYSGLAWGRETLVGLTTPYGRVDLGRLQLQGTAADPLLMADPTRAGGSYAETLWPGLYTGSRFNEALRYRAKVGAVFGSLFGAFDRQSAPARTAGRTLAATLGYADGPSYASAAYQTNRDKNDRLNEVFSAGGTYQLGSVTLHGAYMHARREQGFVMGAVGEPLAVSGLGLGANVPSIGGFSINFAFAGITYRWSAVSSLKSAYYDGKSKGGTLISTESGRQQTVYAVYEYALSKRTFLEGGFDHNRWTDGWGGFWGSSAESGVAAGGNPLRNGHDSRTGLAAGMRHEF